MPDQSNNYTQVQLGKPVSLLGLLMGMGEGLLIGAGMAQKQLHYQNPPPAPVVKAAALDLPAEPTDGSAAWLASLLPQRLLLHL